LQQQNQGNNTVIHKSKKSKQFDGFIDDRYAEKKAPKNVQINLLDAQPEPNAYNSGDVK